MNELAKFSVRNSDLDLNGHVNNTRYAQWLLDSVSEESHRKYILTDYEINFLAETKQGEEISIYGGEIEPDKFQFQGFRARDQKVVFAALLHLSRIPLS